MSAWLAARAIDVGGLAYAVRWTRPPEPGRPPVVLLHGFSGSSEEWADTAEALEVEGHAAVGIDLPGHGGTGVPTDPDRFAMAGTAGDLTVLLDRIGVGRAHWIGYSMGGRVALHLALAEPARVASLILESASPGIEDEAQRALRRAEDAKLAAAIESHGVPWFVERWETLPIFATQGRVPAAAREAQRARRLQNDAAGLAGALRGLGQGSQPFLGERLRSLPCPTLLLAGALDPKYVEWAERMAGTLVSAEWAIIPAAGHNIHLEQPEAFRRALLDRLRRVGAAAGPAATVPH